MNCINCNSVNVQKDGNHNGMQRYKCIDCKKRFDNGIYTSEFITHFGVKIKNKETNKLTKTNYCKYTTKTGYVTRKNIEKAQLLQEKGINCFIPTYYLNIPNNYFNDKNNYNEKYAKQHFEDCMYNYESNIKYFNKLNSTIFNKKLNSYIKKNKFTEIKDLNLTKEVSGIYILVLDDYKQVYIGMSNNIKKRILRHWNNIKAFGSLIFGDKETSIISIDSFGALDTTRIFIKEIKWFQDVNQLEEKYIKEFDAKYLLNRVSGGINGEEYTAMRNLKVIGSMKKREFE